MGYFISINKTVCRFKDIMNKIYKLGYWFQKQYMYISDLYIHVVVIKNLMHKKHIFEVTFSVILQLSNLLVELTVNWEP